MATFAYFEPWSADVSMSAGAALGSFAAGTGIHRTLDFDGTTAEEAWFHGQLYEGYGGGDIIVRIRWRAATVTSGAAVFDAALESHTLDADDLDADSLGTLVTSSGTTTGSVNGEIVETTITLSTAGEKDSIAAGENFRLRIRRAPANASDTITEDVRVVSVSMDD